MPKRSKTEKLVSDWIGQTDGRTDRQTDKQTDRQTLNIFKRRITLSFRKGNKYENGDGPTKIFRDLGGVVSLQTVKLWIKMIRETGSIDRCYSPGRPRTIRTKNNIQKVKQRLAKKKKKVSTRRLAAEMKISRRSVQRILREDLGCFPHKKIKQPKVTDFYKRKKAKFANWVLNHYSKEDTKKNGCLPMKSILI